MKQLVLLFVLVVLVSAPALADDAQFKLEVTGSDHAGFSVFYSALSRNLTDSPWA